MDEASEHSGAQRLQGSNQKINIAILSATQQIGNAPHLIARLAVTHG
jgi:predicted Abi (CAAX) family protease